MKSSLLRQATNPPNFCVPGSKTSPVIVLCQWHGREDERRHEYELKCLEHFKGQNKCSVSKGERERQKMRNRNWGRDREKDRETLRCTKERRKGRDMERDRVRARDRQTDRKIGRHVKREPLSERQTQKEGRGRGREAPHREKERVTPGQSRRSGPQSQPGSSLLITFTPFNCVLTHIPACPPSPWQSCSSSP